MIYQVLILIFPDISGADEEEKCSALGSPRVSGSSQTDPEVEAEVSSRTGGIKYESEEKKPIVRDSESNTVKSGQDFFSILQVFIQQKCFDYC